MIVGLNLGAGRATFPTTKTNPFTEHLNYALEAGCPEALNKNVQWINTDRIKLEGIQEEINLFRYPWIRSSDHKPFEDSSVDIVWCSHIVEHIPHEIKLSDYGGGDGGIAEHMKMYQRDGDGWFSFFYECWRLLKSGGKLHVLFPYGHSVAGFTDPTHTRFVLPGSFSYFLPNTKAPFDYALPFRFEQIESLAGEGNHHGGVMKIINESWQQSMAVTELNKILRGLPENDPGRPQFQEYVGKQQAAMESYMLRHFAQIEEVYLVFEAIKPS